METYQITGTNFLKEFGAQHYWVVDNKLAWVSIPKNANMATRKVMNAMGAKTITELGNPDVLFCVLSDPRSRLIRGVNEYKQRKNKRKFSITELLEQLLDNPLQFDEHVESQLYYVENVMDKLTHVCRYEHMINDMIKLPNMKAEEVKKNIQASRINKSKAGNVRQIIADNKKLVDDIVEKYFRYDLQAWEAPDTLLNGDLKLNG